MIPTTGVAPRDIRAYSATRVAPRGLKTIILPSKWENDSTHDGHPRFFKMPLCKTIAGTG